MLAEGFAAVDVAEVDFDGGEGDGGDRVSDGDAGVGVGSWVDEDALVLSHGSLNRIDERAFMIRLKRSHLDSQGLRYFF
jgi:hypothetical protein